MEKPGKKLRSRKVYSESFKRARVSEYERGEYTVLQISRLYQLSNVTVYNWIYRYSTYNKKGYKIVEMSESNQDKVKQLEKQIKELQQALGQKQLKLEYWEVIARLAKEKYDIDIEKNFDSQPSK